MNEQFKELKGHLMNIDALVVGHATRIPEAAREAITKEVRSGLAIMVAAEALENSPLERRAFMKDAEDETPAVEAPAQSDAGGEQGAATAEQPQEQPQG